MKMKMTRPTADEIIRPLKMTCTNCKSEMTVYPSSEPEGIGYCPQCSPVWLKSFAIFSMNAKRAEFKLPPLEG